MKGLIAVQIQITDNLEKDQQLLIYGIGGLIGLIVLAMIIILVVVIVRRSKASRAAAMPVVVPAVDPVAKNEAYKPAEVIPEAPVAPQPEEKPEPAPQVLAAEPVKEPEPAQPEPEVKQESEVKKEETAVPVVEETPGKKYDFGAYKDELAGQNPEDKMDEIRRRLEEIKRQRQTEPAPVLPKVEAKIPVAEVAPVTEREHDPVVPEEETHTEEEIDDTRVVNEASEPTSVQEIPAQVVPEKEDETDPVIPKETDSYLMAEETAVPEAGEAKTEETVPEEPVSGAETEREEIHVGDDTYYTVKDEPVMELQRDPEPEPKPVQEEAVTKEKPVAESLPNGKFLPMKKLTFAEWVELFK